MEQHIKGKHLKFISRINRDGLSVENMEGKNMPHLNEEIFKINCLSLTNETYIASYFNSYVVKINK